jgi:serine O-acetyltransferase
MVPPDPTPPCGDDFPAPPSLEAATEAVLRSYAEVGGINHIDGSNLPSKRAIAAICENLLQILFPGFHDEEPIHSRHLARVTDFRLRALADNLRDEVAKSLRLRNPDCPDREAEFAVRSFLAEIPEIRFLLSTDLQAAYDGDPAAGGTDEILVAYPFLEAVATQRAAHRLYRRNLPLLPRIMTEWAHSRTGIDIHPGAAIGSHFFIDHGTGTVIGETCTIGDHVKMYQGVALIARSLTGGQALKHVKRHPTVGDRVTIYAGATIMGGDTVIGAGSTIGANVFLTHSIPPRSLVLYEETRLRILDKNDRDTPDNWSI